MASPFSQNLRIAVMKLEGTPGTAETLVDADYDVRIRNPEIGMAVPPDNEASKFATGDHGEDEAIMGAQSGTVAFNVKMAWGGSVTAEPAWWKLAKACGAKEKAYTTTGIALQPQKAYDNKTITIGVFDIQMGDTPAAVLTVYSGCIGTMIMGAGGIGQPWNAAFTFTGKLADPIDVINANILALTSPDTTVAERLLSNTMTIGAVGQRISSFSLDSGNTIAPLINQGEATGYEYFGITGRAPRFACDPLIQPVATEDVIAAVKASTKKVISIASTNMTLKIPVGQIMAPEVANREGYINWGQTWRCLRNAGVDSDIADESTWELLIGSRT